MCWLKSTVYKPLNSAKVNPEACRMHGHTRERAADEIEQRAPEYETNRKMKQKKNRVVENDSPLLDLIWVISFAK
jgi:hypothetical protein